MDSREILRSTSISLHMRKIFERSSRISRRLSKRKSSIFGRSQINSAIIHFYKMLPIISSVQRCRSDISPSSRWRNSRKSEKNSRNDSNCSTRKMIESDHKGKKSPKPSYVLVEAWIHVREWTKDHILRRLRTRNDIIGMSSSREGANLCEKGNRVEFLQRLERKIEKNSVTFFIIQSADRVGTHNHPRQIDFSVPRDSEWYYYASFLEMMHRWVLDYFPSVRAHSLSSTVRGTDY